MALQRVVIVGAAGRDFHNFNTMYRGRSDVHVVAFTAAQIPNISGRVYPSGLAGPGTRRASRSCRRASSRTSSVGSRWTRSSSYSDLPYAEVMHKASISMAAGAAFMFAGPKATMLPSTKPVVSICAVRTGAGKSPLTRFVSGYFRKHGKTVAIVRHPMPYGDLMAQAVQRFATMEDLTRAECTIEEREEYEPHLRDGVVVFAGVDYEAILRLAEAEADIVLWDGGNNDFSFYVPNLSFCVADPYRAGHELAYYPGEVNFRMADVIVVSKTDSAPAEGVTTIERNAAQANPTAKVVRAGLKLLAPEAERLRGHRTIVVEDGPTVTHGGLDTGAGTLIAERHGAVIIDPRPFAAGSIDGVYKQYTHLKRILPAMGYGEPQVRDLEETIRRSNAEFVVDGSPVDLARLVHVPQPIISVRYEYDDLGDGVSKVLEGFLRTVKK